MDDTHLVEDLRAVREALADIPRDDILRVLRKWAARWQDPPREVGEEGLNRLSASTGWPRAHLVEALRRAFWPWTRGGLDRLARRASDSRTTVAVVRRDLWLLAILAGRIPALATGAAFRALAAGVPVVLKPSSAEGVFCDLLVESAQRCSDLPARAVRVVKDPGTVASLVREAPACLACGRDETVEAIRRMREGTCPGSATFVGGHRESLVVVFREALESESSTAALAGWVAGDCAIYDQSGCLSPQVVLVEEGGRMSPGTFARMVLARLQALETRWPPAPPAVEEAATLRLFAEECRLLAARGEGLALPERGPARPLVTLMPHGVYRPGPGRRVLQVLTFRGQPDFARQVPSLAGRLQGLAVAGPRARLDAILRGAPAYLAPYVCRPGRLQSPPADWLENGLDLTAELVRLGTTGRLKDASRR